MGGFGSEATEGPGRRALGTCALAKGVVGRGHSDSALSTSTYKAAWTYTSSVNAAAVRLVANGHVYVEDADGRLVVLDEKTGKVAWSYRRYPTPPPMSNIVAEDDSRGFVVPGIATAKARLFVPGAEGTLVASGKG
ncbi:hypothetical protein GCM10010273_13630 [Streptomyces lavendulocolor]